MSEVHSANTTTPPQRNHQPLPSLAQSLVACQEGIIARAEGSASLPNLMCTSSVDFNTTEAELLGVRAARGSGFVL